MYGCAHFRFTPAVVTTDAMAVGAASSHSVIFAVSDRLEPILGYDRFAPLRGLSDTLAVGDAGTVVDPVDQKTIASPTTAALFGVFSSSNPLPPPLGNSEDFIVGANGTILRRQVGRTGDGTVKAMTSPTTKTLRAVSGTSTQDVWAVGDDGEIIHWNGTAWSAGWRAATPGKALRGIAAGDAKDVWAVGDGGVALHWDGTAWTSVATGTTANLNAIAVYPNPSLGTLTPYVAVGDAGAVLKWTGVAWTVLSSPSGRPLYAVCIDRASIIAGGVGGAYTMTWPSAPTWSPYPANMGNESEAPALGVTASGDLWAAYSTNATPSAARILHYVGGTLTTVSMLTYGAVNRIFEVPNGSLWFSSTSGMLRWTGSTLVLVPQGSPTGGTTSDDLWMTALQNAPASLVDWSGTAANDIWGIDAHALWHWNGSVWSARPTTMPANITGEFQRVRAATDGVWILSATEVLKWNGLTLEEIRRSSQEPGEYPRFWPITTTDIWVTSILDAHWNGIDWTEGSAQDIRDLVGAGRDVWAAESRDILHLAR